MRNQQSPSSRRRQQQKNIRPARDTSLSEDGQAEERKKGQRGSVQDSLRARSATTACSSCWAGAVNATNHMCVCACSFFFFFLANCSPELIHGGRRCLMRLGWSRIPSRLPTITRFVEEDLYSITSSQSSAHAPPLPLFRWGSGSTEANSSVLL